jgi:hypothetical protein
MIRKLGETQVVLKVDIRTLAVVALAGFLTVYYARQCTVLALATYETVKSMHWSLVTAPFEAAVNAAHGKQE